MGKLTGGEFKTAVLRKLEILQKHREYVKYSKRKT
jgi:hypothetical protein